MRITPQPPSAHFPFLPRLEVPLHVKCQNGQIWRNT
uniref:Uncharacterized protein n=1 Tax=Anguilla anguilla TaxID=7936 RepID=A0A0E9TJG6_ANGAN